MTRIHGLLKFEKDEQELRIERLRQQVDEEKKMSQRNDSEAALRYELLQLEVAAKRTEIQRNEAMATFFESASKALNEKRLSPQNSEFTVLANIIKAPINI